jgi:hypothetical protein
MYRGAGAALISLVVAQGGCSKGGGRAEAAAPGDKSAVSAAQHEQLIEKINIYVACLNNLNPAVKDSRERYLKWVDPQKGPSGKGSVDGVWEVSRETTYGYECFKRNGGLDQIESKPFKVESLDKAGLAYKQAALEVMAETTKGASYYKHGDYKDDNFQKGREMHQPLMEAFAKFDHATHDLHVVMTQLQDKMAEDELAELEKTRGKKALWHHRNVMQKADLLIRAVVAGGGPTQARVEAPGQAFTQAWTDMKAWSDQNAAEAAKNVHWSNFIRYSEEIVIQLKEMDRAFRAHKIPKEGNGSASQFIARYNQLVNLSNMMWN